MYRVERYAEVRRSVYVERYAEVRRSVYVEGLSERAAARRFGLARETVRKMLRYRLPPGYRRAKPIGGMNQQKAA